ncbi:MAG: hypothetical protein U9N38_01190 [Thermodesulfobacteriota bacterium]|nr:hypothetical protein [Thermodesulfobacteriota bacterium]
MRERQRRGSHRSPSAAIPSEEIRIQAKGKSIRLAKRADISHGFFNCAEFDAACAVVMAAAERYKSLKHIVQSFACFKEGLCIVTFRQLGRLFIFEAPLKIGKIGQSRYCSVSQGA